MSNSLIPYSFTPGTKAKAQEVNANFIALAEKIEENREFTTTRIAETVEQIEQAASDADEKKADKDFGNTNLVTKCIIEAPNGVVEASENIITVKAGLKVNIPNGYNIDGSVNNIVYTVQEDITVSTVKNSYLNCLYVTPNGCNYAYAYYEFESEPSNKTGIWYNPASNKTYLWKTDARKWVEIQAIVIAMFENTNDIVVFKRIAGVVNLLTTTDRLTIMSWITPSYPNEIGVSMDTDYIAKTNGWVIIFGIGQGSQWEYIKINGKEMGINWVLHGSQAANTTCFAVKRGDTYRIYGNFYVGSASFVPMEGELKCFMS